MKTKSRQQVHKFFLWGIYLKALNGVLEVVGGVILWVCSSRTITHWIEILTQGHLIKKPDDPLANFLLNLTDGLSVTTQLYASVFMLSHGVIKLSLVLGLLKRKMWAYPAAIIIFGLFLLFLMNRYFHSGSPILLFLSGFELAVICFTYLEYRNLRH